MDEAILFGIVQEVLKNVGSTAIREIAAAWGFKARLEKLNNTINTLKDVLLDAEDKQADSRPVRAWLERLTTVVYAADDLFDEFNTVASRKQLMGSNNFTAEVQTFFSSNNQMKFAFRVSQKIKSIREKLDEIVENGRQFDFVRYSHQERRVMNRPTRDQTYSFVDAEDVIGRDQTYSYVDADRVIGRDEDKKAILDMLITSSSSDEEQLTVISIVGMGGMGKTALAQLIFNDPQVEPCFEKRLWVCVSEAFDIKDITEKILKSATDKETPNLEMEQLQGRLRGVFSGKKYLLVLDDVWNEDREKWLELRDLLKVGSKGSKILVTARLKKVAKKMDAHLIHELQGLSEEKSWDLFESVAFKAGQAQQKSHLVKIGKEIVKKCANVPLAIRALGSLLYGEDDENRWLSFIGRDQTYSYVDADRVIGRDEDKKAILDMMITFSSSDEEQLTVISIVGMGGMGKTALAQLIFNDPQVKGYFEKRLWVCVSDVFDITDITKKILKSTTINTTEILNLDMEQLQGPLRGIFSGKKYLLVLDDVWNEDHEKWVELRDLLKVGSKGSKILVTTRLKKVAKKMDAHFIHELQGLSEEKSWDLFERVAFEAGQAQQKSHLVKIGKEIVKKCANVPLAIRALGSLLHGEDGEKRWSSFKNKSLASISGDRDNDIINILKLSYNHLWSPLKNCFAYCSLFPKDTELDKERLKDLWMAEGFIIPEENQSLDDAAEDYFQTLLQRGFFQDVKRNEWGTTCKMHDLMHDLAQQVAGVKCKLAKSTESNFDDKILHLSFAYHLSSLWEIPNGMLNLKLLRTFLLPEQFGRSSFNKSICRQLTMRFCCLRVLDLHCLSLMSLPSSIGKLIHLRFLNLSHTDIEELPDSITDLHNLQTLNLIRCERLRTLPENIRKLAKLRSLCVNYCWQLTHMPSGLGGLTSMNRLPKFIVSHNERLLRSKPKSSAKLSDLKELNNLRGDLSIQIYRDYEKNMREEAMEADLIKKQGLTEFNIDFSSLESTSDNECKHDEAVLEGLKPHSNLRKLSIKGYRGQNLPSWARRGELCRNLSNLVQIDLCSCSCEQVPMLSQLRDLKDLTIGFMDRVEYIEIGECDTSSSSSKSQGMQAVFFPSLVNLYLHNMRNLKGWWKGVEAIESTNGSEITSTSELVGAGQQYDDDHQLSLQFCNLSKLTIMNCPELKSLPYCPNLEGLGLYNKSERPSVLKMADMKLKDLEMNNVEHQLKSIPKQCWHQLSSLKIKFDDKIVNTKSIGDVFETLSNSLRSLEFYYCDKLRSISRGLEHLTALENLTFSICSELELSGDEEETSSSGEGDEDRNMMMPWLAFKTNLRYLELSQVPKMMSLPSGLQHLTNLRYLRLYLDEKLTEIPEWISCLSSLEELSLSSCPKLRYIPEALRNRTSLRLSINGCPGLT